MTADHIIANGRVAVLIHDAYGVGWSTDSGRDPFDTEVVRFVLKLGPEPVPRRKSTFVGTTVDAAAMNAKVVPCGCRTTGATGGGGGATGGGASDGDSDDSECGCYTTRDVLQMRKLRVAWVPLGVPFRVGEYDGKEHVEVLHLDQWFTVRGDRDTQGVTDAEVAALVARGVRFDR